MGWGWGGVGVGAGEGRFRGRKNIDNSLNVMRIRVGDSRLVSVCVFPCVGVGEWCGVAV